VEFLPYFGDELVPLVSSLTFCGAFCPHDLHDFILVAWVSLKQIRYFTCIEEVVDTLNHGFILDVGVVY